jgi:hypothetical protein
MLLWQILIAAVAGGLFYIRKVISFFRGGNPTQEAGAETLEEKPTPK